MRRTGVLRLAFLVFVAIALLGAIGYMLVLAAGDRQLAEIFEGPGPRNDIAEDSYGVLRG